jgi:hypothetical protein
MNRIYLLNLIFIVIIALVLIPSLKIIADDEDSSPDTFFNSYVAIFSFCELLACVVLVIFRLFFNQERDALVLAPIISYLERQEKSPPV